MSDEKRQAYLDEKLRSISAYQTGRAACKIGIRREDNPHPEDSIAADDWDDGWVEAAKCGRG